jgi:hypothetical protein
MVLILKWHGYNKVSEERYNFKKLQVNRIVWKQTRVFFIYKLQSFRGMINDVLWNFLYWKILKNNYLIILMLLNDKK